MIEFANTEAQYVVLVGILLIIAVGAATGLGLLVDYLVDRYEQRKNK